MTQEALTGPPGRLREKEPDRGNQSKEVVTMDPFAFALLTTLVSIAALVLIVMMIVRGITHRQNVRHKAYKEALDRGVYDPSLLQKKRRGYASLGWGLVLTAMGIGMLIGFIFLGILSDGAPGVFITLFIGIALIAFHVIVTMRFKDEAQNGEPVKLTDTAVPPSPTPPQ